tara:strand:+ start:380 stop:1462 length:1083 start_codon:yes stop_codon:yes gene_type:complete
MKKTVSAIRGKGFKVLFSNEAYVALNSFLETEGYSSIFILVDNYTKEYCLNLFLKHFSKLNNASIIKMNAGEENKNLKTCHWVWQQLSDLGADRKSLLINLGGGVVTDLGGFVAATFKRGIDFINVPTTLLSMVDASVGGKTGVDFRGLKNQIGIITHPKMVIIDSQYLKTLPEKEYKSGYAEMLKHGIIRDKEYFKKLSKYKLLKDEKIEDYIHHSVSIKNIVVNEDLYESNIRKILNFGHTLGHAIETHCLNNRKIRSLPHGEAIAIGMIIESYLASQVCGLDLKVAEEIKSVFLEIFPKVSFSNDNLAAIIGLLKYDKKNSHGKIKFVLLYALGQPAIDIEVPTKNLLEGFDFYKRD